ncbi:TetR/AcrR family transcriptional regulator [Tsuneonella sp. CC-YZS046]|uniref:TetR/AcrR family transcriptional regulator n=1 Tax=Tsuneonella sp. CC-YZS046 TaxID=3042152 RepID=UPI002D79ADBE|nr:TetR/AcrR family transcriptional regulator [Tsuneonella sp. CC-YZS046]WRO66663.1 TetR/AcrR family transcriptional regulator [Tsuneonella sp. CC-YZS046]
MAIAEEDSADAVTLGKVAKRLEVTPMALYRHIDDKKDLDQLIATSILKKSFKPLKIDADTPWRCILLQSLEDLRIIFSSFPTVLAVYSDSRFFMSPEHLSLLEQIHEGLARCGVPPESSRTITRILAHFVYGFVSTSLSSGAEGLGQIERMFLQLAESDVADEKRYPRLTAAISASQNLSTGDFSACLDWIMDILATKYAST